MRAAWPACHLVFRARASGRRSDEFAGEEGVRERRGQPADNPERPDPPDGDFESVLAKGAHDLVSHPRCRQLGLGRWGISLLSGRRRGDPPLSTSILFGLRAFFHPAAAAKIEERYELRIGGEPFTAIVQRGRLEIRSGLPERPAATLHADPAGLLDVRFGRIDVKRAVKRDLLRFNGPDARSGGSDERSPCNSRGSDCRRGIIGAWVKINQCMVTHMQEELHPTTLLRALAPNTGCYSGKATGSRLAMIQPLPSRITQAARTLRLYASHNGASTRRPDKRLRLSPPRLPGAWKMAIIAMRSDPGSAPCEPSTWQT